MEGMNKKADCLTGEIYLAVQIYDMYESEMVNYCK